MWPKESQKQQLDHTASAHAKTLAKPKAHIHTYLTVWEVAHVFHSFALRGFKTPAADRSYQRPRTRLSYMDVSVSSLELNILDNSRGLAYITHTSSRRVERLMSSLTCLLT
ncbi:unnamed protein product [Ceratitis capitata]|uniref:(Mediterranean fruit fly) hypothetical protein n=1 Tax=Ceratitis capitata TaxID=7213 RepID=A0A811VFM2_CERCA|nr:unnamed protein product [Ceratitis capitata]